MSSINKLGWVAVLTIIFLSACSSMGNLGSSGVVYNKSYNKMGNVVEQAIKSYSLSIDSVNNVSDKKVIIVFSKAATLRDRNVPKDKASVTIESLQENKTKVIIDNPDYHFTIPNHEKVNYKSLLKKRIDTILGM
ncbi:hypothetical protein [Fodinibius saliphilus]|uniref:hypothetical protein n=1 Tax=Fodinibius saliphilus TaxID=1920650 RepID=UPI0011084725|nr:hypothetical protein [Fodinibius saliphilus]